MKLKLLIISLTFLTFKGFAQDVTKVFDEVKNVTIRNIGPITKNNQVKGYYSFYEFDKIDRKTRLFRINLSDENLNALGTKDVAGPKDWELISSGYDGNNFCFKFWDEKAKTFELKVYNQDAIEVASNSLKINYNFGSYKPVSFGQMVSGNIGVIENNGFVNYTYNSKNDAFITSYANGDTKNTWQQAYEPEGKSRLMLPTFLSGNGDFVLTAVARVERGLYNAKTEHSVIGNSTKDGSQLFELSTDFEGNHVVPINAIFEGDNITIVGLNYKSTKTYSSPPDGFAFLMLDKNGKLLKSNFKTFEESLGKFLPMEDHKLAGNYNLFIHDIVRTNHNTNLVIGEKFKKATDAGLVTLTALSMLAGGTGAPIKITLQNLVVIEYDMEGNAIQATEIPKAEGSTGAFPSYIGLLPSYLLAAAANAEGVMDYKYMLKNEDSSEITFSFEDYGKIDDDSRRTKNFGQIKYKNGKFSVDKIPVKKEKATFSQMYAAKTGHVLQVNYFKKDKKLTMELVKLNN
jgi:hypothetical protein